MTTTILHVILTVSEKYVTTSVVLLFGLFTAARDQPEPERPNTHTPERPNTASWGMIVLYCVLGLTATVVVVFILYKCCCWWTKLLWLMNNNNGVEGGIVVLHLHVVHYFDRPSHQTLSLIGLIWDLLCAQKRVVFVYHVHVKFFVHMYHLYFALKEVILSVLGVLPFLNFAMEHFLHM